MVKEFSDSGGLGPVIELDPLRMRAPPNFNPAPGAQKEFFDKPIQKAIWPGGFSGYSAEQAFNRAFQKGKQAVSGDKLIPTMQLRFERRKTYWGGDMGHPEVTSILQQYWNPRDMPHIIDGIELGEWRDVPLVDEAPANQEPKP